jgi:antitoxin component of RelBE/YafQ-DinJ toxin-antitoxin module
MKKRYNAGNPKNHLIAIRLDDAEKQSIQEYCEEKGISITDLIRIRLSDLVSA